MTSMISESESHHERSFHLVGDGEIRLRETAALE